MSNEPDRNPRKALGRGLSALLPQKPPAVPQGVSEAARSEPHSGTEETFLFIPLSEITPNEEQPRDGFDQQKLEELAQSIVANGVIQPITVARIGEGKYRIIAGERRWRAARLAGLKEIPALVRGTDQSDGLELALIENIQREDLNPVEIAMAFQRLVTEYKFSHEQIAASTGKDRSTVTNLLRLLKLAPAVLEQLARGAISVGHARALLNLNDPEAQLRACEEITAKQLSVRQTEQLVKKLTNPPEELDFVEHTGSGEHPDPNVRAALEEMSRALGTRVKLVAKTATSGRLEMEYYSQEDLDRIYSVIVKQ